MNTVLVDLTYKEKVIYKLNKGVSYQLFFKPSNPIDTNYTLIIGGKTYTVGNGGITLNPSTNTFIVNIGINDFAVGTYNGELVSDSRQAGTYLFLEIEFIVIEN